MSSLSKKLAKAKKLWDKGAKEKAAESSFAEFDDGRYIAKLVSASIGESATSDRLQIAIGWMFQEGDYEDKKVFDYLGCETEENLVWVGRFLARLGYELPDDFDDVPEMLEEIVEDGIVARITLKSTGEFQNIRVQKVLSSDAEENGDEEDEDEDPEESDDTEEEEEDEEGEEKPKKRAKKKKKPEPEEEEEDEEDDDEEDDDEEEDSEGDEEDDEEDDEELEEFETGEDDDEDEEVPEEPEEKPKKKKKKGDKKGKKKKRA